MSSNPPSKRICRAKSELTHRRTSMDSMKTDFRNKFLERLRKTRSRSVDRFRHIVETCEPGKVYKSLNELRQDLLNDQEAMNLIDTEEVNELLQEVEREMRQCSLEHQAESYVNESKLETEDAVNRLMSVCQVCQTQSVEAICPNCNAQLSSEFK